MTFVVKLAEQQTLEMLVIGDTWWPHGGEDVSWGLLGCDTVVWLPAIGTNVASTVTVEMVRSSEMLVPTCKTIHYVITHNTRIQIPVVIKFKNALKMVAIDSSETPVTTWVTELNAIIIQTTTIQIFTAIKRQMSCVLIPNFFSQQKCNNSYSFCGCEILLWGSKIDSY